METIDGATGKPEGDQPKRNRRKIPLATITHVRTELAIVYRKMERGKLDAADGTKHVYALRQLADVITMEQWEERLLRLEKTLPAALPAPADDGDDDGEQGDLKAQDAQLVGQ